VKFRVVLEYDPVAEGWSAVCPELPGCASAGNTEAEARRNIEDAIRLYLAPSDIELPQDAKLVEVIVGWARDAAPHGGWSNRHPAPQRIQNGREFRKPPKVAKSRDW
jgi:predicted RNase H-like HicB family nuclease